MNKLDQIKAHMGEHEYGLISFSEARLLLKLVEIQGAALEFAKGQLMHAGYTKNAVPAIEKAQAEVDKLVEVEG